MYQIFADSTLIYDSTLEDYKIGKGEITLEVSKAGSFVFSVYPDHFFYDSFVKLKTVITVYKSGRIVFRGRVLEDVTDYWNNKVLTCEGELSFLQDSIVRPFEFQGAHNNLFRQFIEQHNAQVDEFKRFKIGGVTVVDENNYINRSSTDYGSTLDTMHSALNDSVLGGYLYITHGDDGTEPIPTIHYVADFPNTATQSIEFGSNLRDYTKTTGAQDLATAIIPLGSESESDGKRTTIESVNDGKDYIYNAEAVALYGWVFKTVVWEDVAIPNNLLTKARSYLSAAANQAITIELNAIDLHLLDRSIESFRVCDYVHVSSQPHGFDAVMLCNTQTMDLLNPERDTLILGYRGTSFIGSSVSTAASVSTLGKTVSAILQDAANIQLTVEEVEESMSAIELRTDSLSLSVTNGSTSATIQLVVEDEDGNPETIGDKVTIQMTGLVRFTDLGANGTTEIDGGRITTGTINADRIDVENLKVSAANITGQLKIGNLPDSVAETSDIPTKVSQLMNDSQYATTAAIPTRTSQLTNDSSYATTAAIPTKTSQLTNNSGYTTETGVVTIINGIVDADYVTALGIYATELVSMDPYDSNYRVEISDGVVNLGNGRGILQAMGRLGVILTSPYDIYIGDTESGSLIVYSNGVAWTLGAFGWERL